MEEKQKYIHYGASSFHEFLPVHNQPMITKPYGGFWASPTDAKFGWYDWCIRTEFESANLNQSFEFVLSEDANILHLYSASQLDDLPKNDDGMQGLNLNDIFTVLDFEELQKTYDGIELHLSEEQHTQDTIFGKGLYFRLYGWDCDSILLFNYKVVHPII